MRLVATGPLGGHAVIPFVDLKMSEQKELPYLESLVGHRQFLTVYRDKLLCDVISFFQCSLKDDCLNAIIPHNAKIICSHGLSLV